MPLTEKHSSKSYDNDLRECIDLFMTMGQMSAEQVTLATHALVDSDVELAKKSD